MMETVPFWLMVVETPVWVLILLAVGFVVSALINVGLALSMRGMATPEVMRVLADQAQLIYKSIPADKVEGWIAAGERRAKATEDNPFDDLGMGVVRSVHGLAHRDANAVADSNQVLSES